MQNEDVNMGFLDKFFGKEPDRSQWAIIVNKITVGLEEVCLSWFESCVDIYQETFTFKNRTLDVNGLRSVKAYQLYWIDGYMAQHQYISPKYSQEFCDLLFAQVCGSDLENIDTYFIRYNITDGSASLFRFCNDMAEYITGEKNSVHLAMALMPITSLLCNLTLIVLAESFGDQRAVRLLQQVIKKEGADFAQNVENLMDATQNMLDALDSDFPTPQD